MSRSHIQSGSLKIVSQSVAWNINLIIYLPSEFERERTLENLSIPRRRLVSRLNDVFGLSLDTTLKSRNPEYKSAQATIHISAIVPAQSTQTATLAHQIPRELLAMYNSSQSQLTFKDDLDDLLISQPNEFSQMNFNDFTLPSQTQASQSDHFGSQVGRDTWISPPSFRQSG